MSILEISIHLWLSGKKCMLKVPQSLSFWLSSQYLIQAITKYWESGNLCTCTLLFSVRLLQNNEQLRVISKGTIFSFIDNYFENCYDRSDMSLPAKTGLRYIRFSWREETPLELTASLGYVSLWAWVWYIVDLQCKAVIFTFYSIHLR